MTVPVMTKLRNLKVMETKKKTLKEAKKVGSRLDKVTARAGSCS